jgi:hypothetical protein
MGVSTHIYGVYGIRIDWNDQLSELYDEVYDQPDVPHVISDGMMGEYMVLGHQFYNSGDIRYGMEDGDQFKALDVSKLAELEQNYKQNFIKYFPTLVDLMTPPFEIIVFTHWS